MNKKIKNYLVPDHFRMIKCKCGEPFHFIFSEIFLLENNDLVQTLTCDNCQIRYCRRIFKGVE